MTEFKCLNYVHSFAKLFFLDSQRRRRNMLRLGSTGRFPWGGSLAPSWPRSRSTRWQSAPCMFSFFAPKPRLEPAKSCKDVLNRRENLNRQEESLGVASVIIWEWPWSSMVEGYVHGDANILLGSLKRWLPMNHRQLPELLEIELPRRKQHDQRYTQNPIIWKFLDETVRELSVDGKRIRMDYVGDSNEPAHKNHEYASTWFLRATIRVPPGRIFEDVLGDQTTRQTTSLQAASLQAAHICIRARLRALARSPSRDDCSLQTAASFSTGNAAGMAGWICPLRGWASRSRADQSWMQ